MHEQLSRAGQLETRSQLPLEQRAVFRHRPQLLSQLDSHLGKIFDATGRTSQELLVVHEVLGRYFASRYERGEELKSMKVSTARNIAGEYFNGEVADKVFVGFNLCMDRRTRKTLMLGVPGRFGGSLRYPGGSPSGFTRVGFGEELNLDQHSQFAREMATSLRINRHVLQIVDSHYGCKHRSDSEEDKTGQAHKDYGVGADRRYKGHMIRAIKQFAEPFENESLTFVQTSFNPETGFLDLLDENNFEEVVFSTKDLAYNGLQDIFTQHAFKIDWLNDYESSSLTFWRNMQQLSRHALPIVKDYLHAIYPRLDKKDPIKFGMKSRIALANAYSGWLNNQQGEYPHNYHNEDLVVALSGGEHGPFTEIEAFEIPIDVQFRQNASYAARLVRDFRTIGSVSDPVPVVLQVRVDVKSASDLFGIGELTSRITEDLFNRGNEWMEMDYQSIILYLQDFARQTDTEISLPVGIAIAELIRNAQIVYSTDVDDRFSEAVYSGSIIPTFVLVDANRSPIAILPIKPVG